MKKTDEKNRYYSYDALSNVQCVLASIESGYIYILVCSQNVVRTEQELSKLSNIFTLNKISNQVC